MSDTDTNVTKDAANKTLVMERVFVAPRERVWQAWADSDQLAKWWGPHGWETTISTFEFKPGGVWHYGMKCIDKDQGEFFGQISWGKAVYESIDEPESLTYKDYFVDAEGTVIPDMPVATVAVQFMEEDGTTRLRTTTTFDTEEGYNKVVEMGVIEGMTQTWDRLEEFLAKQRS